MRAMTRKELRRPTDIAKSHRLFAEQATERRCAPHRQGPSTATMPVKDLSNIILNNKYQLKKRVGSGSYGIVYSAVHLYTGISYAIKIILKNNSPNTNNNKQLLVELEKSLIYQSLLNNGCLNASLLSLDSIEKYGTDCKFLREISLQLKVHKHPNVLSIYKVYDFQNSIFVVMDYYPNGDLFTTIVDQQRYKDDPFLIKSVFIQLIDAITYCHSKSVFHCDLKPENILVADNGTRLILADFGLALEDKFISSNISCGSSYYMSPERIQNFSQAFNSLESHSIHLERLLNANSNSPHNIDDPNYHAHGNVKFPTSAGDVWSLAVILINLVSIRNPWLKASLHDTTFKAFVQNPKILMKILPISNELFIILQKYLHLNPWERGNLFDFRYDVLHCSKLTESGPLAIDSTISSMDIITTESQVAILNNPQQNTYFETCPMPVDHVMLDKIRSGELDTLSHNEVENEYLPNGTKKFKKPAQCKSCVECGFGYDSGSCGSIENNPLHTTNTYSSTSTSSSSPSIISGPDHVYPQTATLPPPPPQQQQQQVKPEHKHENLLKKFFKYGPGGYNPNNFLGNSSGSSTPTNTRPRGSKHHRHYLSPFKSQSEADQQQLQQQQQLLQRQQLQMQLQLLQQQKAQQQELQQQQQQEAQKQAQDIYLQQQLQQQYQQQLLQMQQQEEQDRLLRQQHQQLQQQQQQQQHHHHHHHHQQEPLPEVIPQAPAQPDYTSIFPMPGMAHKPQIAAPERPRRKFVTKRRQRKSSITGTGAIKEKKSNSKRQEDRSSNSNNSAATNSTNVSSTSDIPNGSNGDSNNDSEASVKSYHEPSQESQNDTESQQYNSADHYNNHYHNASNVNSPNSQGDIAQVQQTLSTMSILGNPSGETMEPMDTMATMATYGTVGSRMDQRP